jgi:CRISPR/Cas system-associated exonuclease Cas4 (RecB family)
MIDSLFKNEDEPTFRKTPYLSHSRISKYLDCPEKYRLYYVENLRPRVPSASLVFGQLLHQALSRLFKKQDDPVKWFSDIWNDIRQMDISYGKKESWESLHASGQRLLERFLEEELPKLRNVAASEEPFELAITTLHLPFVGIIDLVASLEGKQTVVDFKTSASSYQGHEVLMADQLTAYQLARPDAEQTALCVLVKTKASKIEWQVTRRTSPELANYLEKLRLIGGEIASGHFYKRPGMWCTWCDFLPVCLGDRRKAEETLIKVR